MSKANLVVYCVLLLIIVILVGVTVFRKPDQNQVSDRERLLQDSIALLQRNIDSSHVRQDKLQKSYDSLLAIDPVIISRTRDKINFIYTVATPDELDSIIRANWKTKSRYR